MEDKMVPVIQIVGYKNSGKTTVAGLLIQDFKESGLKLGVIKHHGHGGKPDRVEGTDSSKYLEAGAACSAVYGDGEWQFTVTDEVPVELNSMIQMQEELGVHMILIEGFKQLDFPKIVLLRDEQDKELLGLSNIRAVGGWDKPHIGDPNFCFSINEYAIYKKALMELLISG